MFEINELINATGARLVNRGHRAAIKGISTDSRNTSLSEAFIALKGDNFDGHHFIKDAIKKGARCIIVEKRNKNPVAKLIPMHKKINFLEVNDTLKALGDIACFHRNRFDIPVIAITGSNGKTTTKEMIAWVLSRKFKVLKNEGTKNNQIGVPLALLNLTRSHEIAVLEIGTNHFGEVGYLTNISRPTVGIITNIGPAHLEHFNNLEGVLKEKYTLLKGLSSPAIGIVNADDVLLRKKLQLKNKDVFMVGFGMNREADFFATDIKSDAKKLRFMLNGKYPLGLKALGYCNIYNALASASVARIFGLTHSDIASRLSLFEPPYSRLTLKKLQHTQCIDDSYNSNPLSLKQALHTLHDFKVKGRKIFVMGDMLELGESKDLYHSKAGESAAEVCDVFITVGKLSRAAAIAAAAVGFDTGNIFTCKSCDEAKEVLFKKVSPGQDDVVLIKGSRLMRLEEIIT